MVLINGVSANGVVAGQVSNVSSGISGTAISDTPFSGSIPQSVNPFTFVKFQAPTLVGVHGTGKVFSIGFTNVNSISTSAISGSALSGTPIENQTQYSFFKPTLQYSTLIGGVSAHGGVARQAFNDWNIKNGVSFGAISGSDVDTQAIGTFFRPIQTQTIALNGLVGCGQIPRVAYNDWNIIDGVSFGSISGSDVDTQTISSLIRPTPHYNVSPIGVYAIGCLTQGTRLNLNGFGISGDALSATPISGADTSNNFLEENVSISFPVLISPVHTNSAIGASHIHADCNVITLTQVYASGITGSEKQKELITLPHLSSSSSIGAISLIQTKIITPVSTVSAIGVIRVKDTHGLSGVYSSSAIGTLTSDKQTNINLPHLFATSKCGSVRIINSNPIAQLVATSSVNTLDITTNIKISKVYSIGAIGFVNKINTRGVINVTATTAIGVLSRKTTVESPLVLATSAIAEFTTHISKSFGIVGVHSTGELARFNNSITVNIHGISANSEIKNPIPRLSNVLVGNSSTGTVTNFASIQAGNNLHLSGVSGEGSIAHISLSVDNPIIGVSSNATINDITIYNGDIFDLVQVASTQGNVGAFGFILSQNIPITGVFSVATFGTSSVTNIVGTGISGDSISATPVSGGDIAYILINTAFSNVLINLPAFAANSEICSPNSLIVESKFNRFNVIYAKPDASTIRVKAGR